MLGPLIMDLQGVAITPEEQDMLLHPAVGGVILFTRNFVSLEQLQNLVQQIKSLRDPALLVTVDHEGGRVQRFREGFTVLPPLASLGKYYQQDPQAALAAAKTHAWLMAAELAAVNIDFSFAPVLDIDIGLSSVIGDRAFHHDKNVVTELGKAYIQGVHAAGLSAVGKHFPGHGQVKGDTHCEKPVDPRALQDILNLDAYPFAQCIAAGLDAIMPAHVIYAQVDDCPAGYSSYWLQDVLRQSIGFNGVIFSDDLSMAGAHSGDTQADQALAALQRANKALQAGCDMILVCNDTAAAQSVIDGLDSCYWSKDYQESCQRRVKMRLISDFDKLTVKQLQATAPWQQAQELCAYLSDIC